MDTIYEIFCVKDKDGSLTPITEFHGDLGFLYNNKTNESMLNPVIVPAYYNVEKGKLFEIENTILLPPFETYNYSVGQKVAYEIMGSGHKVAIGTIEKKEIVQDFHSGPYYKKGRKLSDYEKKLCKDLDENKYYQIQSQKYQYTMSDGTVIEYEHEIFEIKE